MNTREEFTTGALVDKLGALRAQAADLGSDIKFLEGLLKEAGPGAYEGDLFRATVSVSERATVAWKAIAEKLGASRQMLTANTKVSEVSCVRVTARLKDAA